MLTRDRDLGARGQSAPEKKMHAYVRLDRARRFIHRSGREGKQKFLTASRVHCLSWTHGHDITADGIPNRGHKVPRYSSVADMVKLDRMLRVLWGEIGGVEWSEVSSCFRVAHCRAG